MVGNLWQHFELVYLVGSVRVAVPAWFTVTSVTMDRQPLKKKKCPVDSSAHLLLVTKTLYSESPQKKYL